MEQLSAEVLHDPLLLLRELVGLQHEEGGGHHMTRAVGHMQAGVNWSAHFQVREVSGVGG